MVTRSRPALGAGLITMLALAVGAPVLGAFEAIEPNPLRTSSTLRIADVATAGDAVAIGWRQGANPGNLVMALSTNRGRTFERANGNLRSYSVLGRGRLGMSLAICGGSVWMGTAFRNPGDDHGDSDVLISRRIINGAGSQRFATNPSDDRRVRDVDIACVGNRLLAIAWIERSGSATRGRLLLRDLRTVSPTSIGVLGVPARFEPSATNSLHNHGQAGPGDGISVGATGSRVFVAWSNGDRRNLQLKRFDIGSGADPTIDPRPTQRVGFRDAIRPELATRGQKVILAYSDDGKVKVRISENNGGSFSDPTTLLNVGTNNVPSFPTSAAHSGQRIVIDAMRKQPNDAPRTYAPVLLQSSDLGESWRDPDVFGNRGPRIAALRKVTNSVSRIHEAWHDDGASIDVLRGRRETSG